MKIKASRINNLTDARYFAAWGVEWMGFCLEMGSPNYVVPQDIKEIKEWLVGPKIVGEFGVGQSAEEINAAVNLLNLDMVQLANLVEDDILGAIQVPVIKELKLMDENQLESINETMHRLQDKVALYLLDMTGVGVDWNTVHSQLSTLCQYYQVVLKLDCQLDDLSAISTIVNPLGMVVEGGEEEAVGVRAFDELDDWFEMLEDMVMEE